MTRGKGAARNTPVIVTPGFSLLGFQRLDRHAARLGGQAWCDLTPGRRFAGTDVTGLLQRLQPVPNWWKSLLLRLYPCRWGGIFRVGTSGRPADTDARNGEIVSPAPPDLVSISRVFFNSTNRFQVEAGCNYFGEEWIATWDGARPVASISQRAAARRKRRDRMNYDFGPVAIPTKRA